MIQGADGTVNSRDRLMAVGGIRRSRPSRCGVEILTIPPNCRQPILPAILEGEPMKRVYLIHPNPSFWPISSVG